MKTIQEKNDIMRLIGTQSENTLRAENQAYFEEPYELTQSLKTQKINTKIDKKILQEQQYVSLIHKPYENFAEYNKKQQDVCFTIAFNREKTIMIAGCWNNITVFEFNQGQLSQKQLLRDHNDGVFTLYFMKKYNKFISGINKEIGIWSYNNTIQQYHCLQMLKQAHFQTVNRVIMNKNEDLIISCSADQTIKFWINQNEWKCSQILNNHTKSVMDICLNDSCTQLVSCDNIGYILISQQGDDQKWRKIQRISSIQGCRLCYINDNLIAFQPRNGVSNLKTFQFSIIGIMLTFFLCNSIINSNFYQIKMAIRLIQLDIQIMTLSLNNQQTLELIVFGVQ